MSSSHRKHSPVRLRSPLPDRPRAPPKPAFNRRDSHTSNLSARSKAYRDTLRMPAMIPAPEDDDNASRIVVADGISVTLNSVNIKEKHKERYMETDAAKANAKIGLPEVRIKPNKLLLPQASSPKRNFGSIFCSIFSKNSLKEYSLEDLAEPKHLNTANFISSPGSPQEKQITRMTDLETDASDEIHDNGITPHAKNEKRRRRRNISLVLLAIFLALAVAGVTIVISQSANLSGNGPETSNEALSPTESPIISVSPAFPETALPTKSPTKMPTNGESSFAPTQAPTLGSITVDDASDLCDDVDEEAFVCINLQTFFECRGNGSPVTGPGSQGPVTLIISSCSGGTSCACAPLKQFISPDLDICSPTSSADCDDI